VGAKKKRAVVGGGGGGRAEMMNSDAANSYLIQKIERVLHYEIRWKATAALAESVIE
jgi:hypothetical protein